MTIRQKRNIGIFGGAGVAVLLLLGAAAWACTAHSGQIWFCSSSASCSSSQAITPAANSSAWVDGGALLGNRTDIAVRYSVMSAGVDACHTGTQFGSNGSTNATGAINGTVAGTTPGIGNWTFCATNGTGDNYADHLGVTLN